MSLHEDPADHPSVRAFDVRAAASVAAVSQAAVAAKEVDRDVERYNELRTHGLAALSSFDINMSGPLNAYRTALELKSAHITSGLTMVHNLRIELADTLKKLGEPPQLALF